eukprot:6897573-Heterocapsa_arctica.AAC.1
MDKMRTELERHESVQIYQELLDIEKGTRRKKGHVITIVDDEMGQQESGGQSGNHTTSSKDGTNMQRMLPGPT